MLEKAVSAIQRRVDAVLNERPNAIPAKFVAEGFRVVAPVSSQDAQVAGVAPSDLRPDPRVVFLRSHAVDVGDVQRLHVHECGHYQRPNAVVRSLSVVPRGLVAIEASSVDRGMAGAFLGRSAEKRAPPSGRDRCEGVAQGGKVRQPREAEVFEDAGHLAEEVDRLPIGFPKFDPACMEREHHPVGEPATHGVGGFVGILDNIFSFRN